jgi:hypothetical protein
VFQPDSLVSIRIPVRPSSEAPGEKFFPRWKGPYRVLFAFDDLTSYRLYDITNNTQFTEHVNNMKLFRSHEQQSRSAINTISCANIDASFDLFVIPTIRVSSFPPAIYPTSISDTLRAYYAYNASRALCAHTPSNTPLQCATRTCRLYGAHTKCKINVHKVENIESQSEGACAAKIKRNAAIARRHPEPFLRVYKPLLFSLEFAKFLVNFWLHQKCCQWLQPNIVTTSSLSDTFSFGNDDLGTYVIRLEPHQHPTSTRHYNTPLKSRSTQLYTINPIDPRIIRSSRFRDLHEMSQ